MLSPLFVALGLLAGGRLVADQTGACRTYATRSVSTITSNGAAQGRVEQTCVPYNHPTNSVRCQLSYSLSGSPGIVQTVTGYYRSVGDFVDEVSVQPPLMRLLRQETTAPGVQSSLEFTYDGENRPLKSVLTSSTGVQNSQFAGWDKAGRYTGVTISSPMAPTDHVEYAYDAAARTMTITNTRIGSTSVVTHDENGNVVKTVSTTPSGRRTIEVAISATEKVCKSGV